MHRAAAAAHRTLVILGDFDTDPRDLMLLVAVQHPKIGDVGQIVLALAVTLREPILLVIGVVRQLLMSTGARAAVVSLAPVVDAAGPLISELVVSALTGHRNDPGRCRRDR